MEKIFVDTSALFALLATEDLQNKAAASVWKEIVERQDYLVTNNYVLVESIALTQSRLGLEFVHHLQSIIVPFLSVEWIDEEFHQSILEDVLKANHRNVSLVDYSTFNTMRQLGIQTIFTFDGHFHNQGFKVIP